MPPRGAPPTSPPLTRYARANHSRSPCSAVSHPHLRAAAVDGGVWSRRCHWAASVDRMSTRRRRQRGPRAPRGTTGLQAAAGAEGWAVRRRRAHQITSMMARVKAARVRRGPGSHTVCTLCAGEACTARDARSCACSESGSDTHAADDFKIVGQVRGTTRRRADWEWDCRA